MSQPPDLSILRGKVVPYTHGSKLVHELLDGVKNGDHTALIYRDQRLSHSELSAAASRLARAMVRRVRRAKQAAGGGGAEGGRRGNAEGDVIIAVGLPQSERLVVTLLAAWKAGAAYLPLDPTFPENRVRHILGEAQPALVVSDLVDTTLFGDVAHASYADLAAEAAELNAEPLTLSVEETLSPSGASVAIVCYTSGSSGLPKGVRIPHSAILNRLSWQWEELPYAAGEDMFVFKTPLTFVDSVAELWGPLVQGRTILVLDPEVAADTDRFVHALEDNRIQRLVVVPSLLRAMLLFLEMDAAHFARAAPLLSRVRLWVSSGEPLPLDLAQQFFAHFSGLGETNHTLCNFYGSTEVMGDVSFHVVRSAEELVGLEQKVPIGRPIFNTEMYVLDELMQPVPVGQMGEIFVAGANLALGYVGGREPPRFVSNPVARHSGPEWSIAYQTGDFGRMTPDPDRALEYEGRSDSLVKVHGRRVHLNEVEAALDLLEEVDKGVVLCHKQGEEQQGIVAFVTLRSGHSMTGRWVETILRNSLPPYAVPHVRVVDRIPFLPNGKVDRQQLLRGYAESRMEPDYSGMPEGRVLATHILLDTVAKVLGASARGRISLNKSFFELGGDSLNSVSTVSRLRELGFFIAVRDFIKSKTLSEALDKLKAIEESSDSYADTEHHSKFHAQCLGPQHKSDVYSIISDGFLQKGDLEMWIIPHIQPADYHERMDMIWEKLLEKNLSFVATDSSGCVVGCALLFDAQDEPQINIHSRLNIIFDFLGTLEEPIRRERIPPSLGCGQVLHSVMVATSGRLAPRQSVLGVQFLEQEVLRTARQRGFSAVLTTNTSPLTQQLARDVFGYETLLDYQTNQYIASDGSRPFAKAPDDQRVHIAWKSIV